MTPSSLAAVQAPSARNTQPWHFSVVQNAALLKEFSDDYNAPAEAPTRAATSSFLRRPRWCSSPRPSRRRRKFSQIDCGIAAQNMALAAHSLGLGSVILGRPMEVFKSAKGPYYEQAFGFPEGYTFAIAVALGEPTVSKEAHVVREGLVNRV